MRDGRTRKLEIPHCDSSFEQWRARWRASVVMLTGDAAGTEYELDAPCVSLGRGPEATWIFADDAMSKEHATLEFAAGRTRLRDLGSMNGSRVNGADVKAADFHELLLAALPDLAGRVEEEDPDRAAVRAAVVVAGRT